ncbi:hypothetical protein VNO77_43727 [Canavalia gladiata]|uniref:Maternal effect embryo arrest 60 n=1 Tax=Canavalia gladiata TaxID=3824 RepID=A0AAN9JUR3_CANGL
MIFRQLIETISSLDQCVEFIYMMELDCVYKIWQMVTCSIYSTRSPNAYFMTPIFIRDLLIQSNLMQIVSQAPIISLQLGTIHLSFCRMSSSFTSLHITALDAIVNVNSLFTLAVFIGLTWNPNDPQNSLNSDPVCAPSAAIAENLVAFHVYSFSSFLFSSLIALALKQAIRLSRFSPPSIHYPHAVEFLVAHVNRSALRVGMLVSGIGSFGGCLFLMLALVNVAQIKLGTLACGSSHTFAAVVPLLILVPLALLIYVSLVLYAFTR